MPEALSSKPQPYRHYWTPNTPYNEIFLGWTHPPKEQIEILERSGQLAMYTSPAYVDVSESGLIIEFQLPRQGVSLIKLDW
jgi:hypothetical protein